MPIFPSLHADSSSDPTTSSPIPDPNQLLAELKSDGKMGSQVQDRFFGQSLRGGTGGTR